MIIQATKKIIFFLTLFFTFIIFLNKNIVFGQMFCPSNTQAFTSSAILVGEITDDGGDPNLIVWFEYGWPTMNLSTPPMNYYGKGIFCAEVRGLTPNQTYYYRAVAENSGGRSYGETKTFRTQCLEPVVDLKVNNSDGPLTLPYQSDVVIFWNSTNTSYCLGSWTSSRLATSGQVVFNQLASGNYDYNIVCYNDCGQSARDTVRVTIQSRPLPVIDFKANNQSQYLEVQFNDNVFFSWTTNYANSCFASGDWSGTKPLSGSETIRMTSVKLYNFFLTCSNENGESQARIQVNVRPRAPVVITKPAVVTY